MLKRISSLTLGCRDSQYITLRLQLGKNVLRVLSCQVSAMFHQVFDLCEVSQWVNMGCHDGSELVIFFCKRVGWYETRHKSIREVGK